MRLVLFALMLMIFNLSSSWGQSGLNYTIYAGTGATPSRCTTCTAQLASGTLSTLNYDWGGGAILNSGRSDRVLMRITGHILWPGSGAQTVNFYDRSDDGFHFSVNNTVVINNWQEQGPNYYNGSGSITLQGGQYYPVEIWWYENGGGAVLQLLWNIGSGIVIVPTSAWSTTAPVAATSGQSSSILLRRQEMVTQHRGVHITQVGTGNTVAIEQASGNNLVRGTTGQTAQINGDYNQITITQNGQQTQRVDLSLVGNSNQIRIQQGATAEGLAIAGDSGGHYARAATVGNNNATTITQYNQGGANSGHFAEVSVTGSNNATSVQQTNTGAKSLFNATNGDNNITTVQQSGQGSHFSDTSVQGSGNSISVAQSGNSSHGARIAVVNSGGPSSVELSQTNTLSQNIQIQQTCVTISGCSVRTSQ